MALVSPIGMNARRGVEYALAACVAVVMLGFFYHQFRSARARAERVERIGAECRKIVNTSAARLASEHPGLKWSAGDMKVLGDLKPEAPDANLCAVEMTFRVGSNVDKESWTVSDLLGNYQLSSARFWYAEAVH